VWALLLELATGQIWAESIAAGICMDLQGLGIPGSFFLQVFDPSNFVVN
jgi:hypothetical protein